MNVDDFPALLQKLSIHTTLIGTLRTPEMYGKQHNPYPSTISGAQRNVPGTMAALVHIHPRISWTCLSQPTALTNADLPEATADTHYFQTDSVLLYEHFFADHGPLNLGQMVRFCRLLTSLLSQKALESKKLVYVCSSHNHRRSNRCVRRWGCVGLGRVVGKWVGERGGGVEVEGCS